MKPPLPVLAVAVAKEIRSGNTRPDTLEVFVECHEQISSDEAKTLTRSVLHDLLNQKWIYYCGSAESHPGWFCRLTPKGYAAMSRVPNKNKEIKTGYGSD
ncbi:MAG TPA: hypothetical protein O0X97_00310 [Methanocorpusculum sp.]|nr:hypothetical protein [Methanocorpusculum sp.]